MDIEQSGREWRQLMEDKRARSVFLKGVLMMVSLFFGSITLIAVLLAVLGKTSWGAVAVLLAIHAIFFLGFYGLIALYLPFMYRVGQRWGERRRLEERKGFLDRPVGPRIKN